MVPDTGPRASDWIVWKHASFSGATNIRSPDEGNQACNDRRQEDNQHHRERYGV